MGNREQRAKHRVKFERTTLARRSIVTHTRGRDRLVVLVRRVADTSAIVLCRFVIYCYAALAGGGGGIILSRALNRHSP